MTTSTQALESAGTSASAQDPSEPLDGNAARCPQAQSWIELSLVQGADAEPMAGEPYELVDAGGQSHKGRLDDDGRARVEHLIAGGCTVTFPDVTAPPQDEASDAPFKPPAGTQHYDPEAAPYTCPTEKQHAFAVPPWILVELLPVVDEDEAPLVDKDPVDDGDWDLVELSPVIEDED